MVDPCDEGGVSDRWHEYLDTPPSWEFATLTEQPAFHELMDCLPMSLRNDELTCMTPTPAFEELIEEDYSFEIETRSIHASNLDPLCSAAELRDLANPFGDIEQIDLDGILMGIAVIRFFDLRAAQQMRLTKLSLRGRTLKFTYGPLLPIVDARRPPNNGTIVVFHLRKGIDDQAVMAEFGQYGDVRQIRSAPAKVTQRFVEFYDTRSAMKALKALKGRKVLNSKVSVEYSLPGGHHKALDPVRPPTIERVSRIHPPCALTY
jgi:RNA recognition motif-containing protein